MVLSHIKKLNVSFNEKMGVDGLSFIGEVVRRCEVKELNIERCNMSSVKVEALFEALEDAKVDKIDVSHNKYMGENGWAALGNIIRACRVAKLRMRLSYMKPNEAHAFSEGIGNAKLHEIDMNEMACSGFKDNVHFASAMNELLPKILDRLDMRGCKLLKDDDLELQKKLNELYPTNLEVDLGDRRQTFVLTAKTPTWQQHTGGTFGPHGGTRTVAGCSVTFPQGAFESENTVNIWLTVPPEDEPGPYITVSPTIRCVSERPMMKMAEVRLPLWISSDDDRVIVRIMRKPEEEEAQWEEIRTMQLSKVKERVLVFNCKFSLVKAVALVWDAINYVKELLGYEIDYYMDCVLYHDLQGNFTAIFHLDSKLVKDGLKEKLTDKRMVSVPKDFQKTVFHIDERVQVQLTVKKTEVSDTNRTQYQFTREKDEFDLDKHFLRNPHHFDTLLDPNPVGNPVLQIKYKYNVKNSAVRVVKVPFRLDWSVQAEEVKELKARQEKDIDKTRTDKGQTSQPNYSNLTNCQIIYSNNNSSGPATDSSPHPAATMTVNDNRMTAKNIATDGSSQKIHETRGTNIIAGSLQTRNQEASVAGSSQDQAL